MVNIKVGILKNLKMRYWKHYSMEIDAKDKNSSRNLWESVKQPLRNV